jgi:hypothetical protein
MPYKSEIFDGYFNSMSDANTSKKKKEVKKL